MVTTQRRFLFPVFALVGLMACSGSSSSDTPTSSTGGATAPAGGSSGGSTGSASSSSGGATAIFSSGGATGSPTTGSGGDVVASSGGDTGPAASSGGDTGPATTDGSGGVTGTGPTGGSTGTVGSAGGAPQPAGGTIPTGYPAPTAANVMSCMSAMPTTAGRCPGGGVGPVCLQCLYGGNTYNNAQTPTADGTAKAGNYLVSVRLGGAMAGVTSVAAESSRGLLMPVMTAPGEMKDFAFVVNVRAMEGQPNHAGGPGGYPGLDLFFSGTAMGAPQVNSVGYALATAATKPIMVYMASDSTECDQTGNVFGGWGQMFPEFFDAPIGIANYGNSGASSSSFYGAYWSMIKKVWTAGDYAFIQFGHNDKGVADATVQANLEKYVSDAQAAGVIPILVSPPARVQFTGTMDGDQSSLHAVSAMGAAAAKNVAYIDLTALSVAWYNSLGSKAAALMFHANGTDATHTNLPGGEHLASLVAGDIKKQNLPIAKYLRAGAVP
jgi:lysophospholipase L1-like esterase